MNPLHESLSIGHFFVRTALAATVQEPGSSSSFQRDIYEQKRLAALRCMLQHFGRFVEDHDTG